MHAIIYLITNFPGMARDFYYALSLWYYYLIDSPVGLFAFLLALTVIGGYIIVSLLRWILWSGGLIVLFLGGLYLAGVVKL